MQHDNVMKNLNFDLLTPNPRVRVGGVGVCGQKHLLPCCCIRYSLYFDIKHDPGLKKINFDLLIPPSKSTQTFDRYSRLICFIFIVSLSACEISAKHIDNWLSYCNIKIFDLWPHLRDKGLGKVLITVMLIYRHWVIMAYCEKLADIIVFEKCEVYSTQKSHIDFALA